ncbi:DUF2953 domain-containing protein [Bacillus salacetis]|uniref:DUF2953 domain-containing protein n=1 Tax=Bacillus salacetis TaxID=2315464 RepID=A0A3A1QRV2_9BACI|nr:DUF2953 domain-containing protein [Bacillus salacetis]RIW27063.1 DUF2953 domain-containing protein [Bacillus salacetis]
MKKVNGWIITLIVISGLLLLLLLLIIITKLTITLSLYHGNDNDHFLIKFRAWYGLVKYKVEVPMVKLDDEGPNIVFEEKTEKGKEGKGKEKDKLKKETPEEILTSIKDFQELVRHVAGFHRIVRHFLSRVKLDDVQWQTVCGTGDASTTGTMTGLIWGAKGSLMGVISGYMNLQSMPQIMVVPSFQKAIIQMDFSCIITFRVGHAILAGIKMIKLWKGGKPDFQSKPLSSVSEKNQTF